MSNAQNQTEITIVPVDIGTDNPLRHDAVNLLERYLWRKDDATGVVDQDEIHRILDSWTTVSSMAVYGALDCEGNLVGVAAATLNFRQGSAYLSRIAVHDDYKGLGIGSGLVRHVAHEAARQGKTILEADSLANHFFAQLGFVAVGTGRYEATIARLTKVKSLKAA